MTKQTHCQLHGVELRHDAIPILYGIYAGPFLGERYMRRLAPNANTLALGGSGDHPDFPKTRNVMFCPECREELRFWLCDDDDGDEVTAPTSPSQR